MNYFEKAQMHHLRRKWHEYASQLAFDERDPLGWYLLDLTDLWTGCGHYHRDGKRRSLDA